eukprot:TRINITY_DN16485_c0_g1_i2.p1 TRINITY_DN16485_c0_g1~~TRINITY_DN16485_c0_g1_i2.p1  ORF type:complete len:292 (+),score=25.04 TRINITY_DN16485_c0_g1_i2:73-948(+)
MALYTLDENDSREPPYVIIPNYVTARSNCLEGSHLFSVCCRSECEQLVERLEQTVSGTSPSPAEIRNAVEAMASKTVPAPRQLSPLLIKRLYEISIVTNGVIQPKSRSFSQWLHYAYPLECSYPNEVAMKPLGFNEWSSYTNMHHEAAMHELQKEVDSDSCPVNLPLGTPCDSGADSSYGSQSDTLWSDDELLMKPTTINRIGWLRFALAILLFGSAAFAESKRRSAPLKKKPQRELVFLLFVLGAFAGNLISQTVFVFTTSGSLLAVVVSLPRENIRKHQLLKKLDECLV